MSAPSQPPDGPRRALGVPGTPDGPGSGAVEPEGVWGAAIEWLVTCTDGSAEGTPTQVLFLTFVQWYVRRCLVLHRAPRPIPEELFVALLDELAYPVVASTDGLGRTVRALAVTRGR